MRTVPGPLGGGVFALLMTLCGPAAAGAQHPLDPLTWQEHWTDAQNFPDTGEFAFGGLTKPPEPGTDCPDNASYVDAIYTGDNGRPKAGASATWSSAPSRHSATMTTSSTGSSTKSPRMAFTKWRVSISGGAQRRPLHASVRQPQVPRASCHLHPSTLRVRSRGLHESQRRPRLGWQTQCPL